jgi:hypothetical protein
VNESQAIALITKYIYERKGVRVHLSPLTFITDRRQAEMLERAVQIAVDYYNGVKMYV